MATLVHDDVLDEAPLRRGHPTAWATHGRAVAVATGDYLFARAFAELAALADPVAIRTVSHTACELAQGEMLQAEQARDPGVAPEAVLERCRLKTGRLFAAACATRRTSRRARPGRLRGPRPVRRAARPGLPAGRRRARLRRRPEAHGQDARHRSARRHDVAAAAACRAIGRGARRVRCASRSRPRTCCPCSRASPPLARSIRSAILPSGYAQRAEAELERAPGSDTAALRALLQRAIDRDS